MANYYLKYYAEIKNYRGQLTRVEIHQRDTQPASVLQIGDVCGLLLEIQGGTEDIYTPIVKTSARLSMISSEDKPTADGIKYGGWEEFYTPDATLYKMVIKTKATDSESSWTARWSGFITPDSWHEELEYRGPVTITARDNIGHLQDFEFDMPGDSYGLAKIKDVLDTAMLRINMPMDVAYCSGADLEADDVKLVNSFISVSKFKGKDWYTAIEDILNAIGYTLRFTDENRVTFAPMRHLPLLGEASEQAQPSMPDLEFYGGDGEQVPAVKSITETHDYDYNSEVFQTISGGVSFGTNQTYRCKVEGNKMPGGGQFSRPEHDAVYNEVTGAGDTVWDTGSDLLNINNYDQAHYQSGAGVFDSEGDRWNQYAFLAANGVEGNERTQSLHFFCGATDITVRAIFAKNPAGLYTRSGVTSLYKADDSLSKIKYKLWFENGGVIRYWTGSGWRSSEITIEKEFDPQNEYATDLEIALQQCDDLPEGGVLHLAFLDINYKMYYNTYAFDGVYARLASISVAPNVTNLSKNTVKTINDDKYNVRLERNTEISPLSRETTVALPDNYPSALFYYPSGSSFPKVFPYMGNWDNVSGDVVKPFLVLVHQQILCYRGASLWQLSGECAPKNNALFWFNSICVYKNRNYILQGGTLDFTNGMLQGAILREFLEYDDIWDDTEPGDWSDSTEYPGSGAASTSSSAGSSLAPSGGGNYFEPDGNGGIKLKDEYTGLWTNGFLDAKGAGSGGSGGGGVTLDEVWASLTDNTTKPNVTLHTAHIPWASMPVANTATIGGVKVDGTTITIDANGVISATAQGGGSVNSLTVGTTNYTPDSSGIITIPAYPTSLPASDVYLWAKAASKPSYSLSEISGTSDLQAIEALTGTGLLKRTGSNTWALDTSSYLTAVPKATDSVIGGFQTGYSESGKNYAVKMSGNKAYVNVPWTDTVYTHPTGGANTTITAAAGKVLSAITVDSLGHVSSVSSKTLATTDIPDLSGTYLPLTGGTLTGALRMKPSGANHGGKINFGDNEYVYLYEDTDDHLKIYASKGLTIDCGSSYSIEIAKALSVSGNVTVGSSASSKNLTIYGTLYFSGSTAYLSYSSANSGIVSSVGIYSNTYVNAAASASSSDARLKDGITTVSADRAISLLTALRGCEWAWNGKKAYLEGQHGSGLIAQEVQKVMPWMVLDLGGELSLTYNSLWGIAVPVMQSHEERIKALEAEVEDLKKKLNHVA